MRLTNYFAGILALLLSWSAMADIYTPFHAQYNAYRNGQKLGTANQLLEKLNQDQFKLTYQTDVSYFFLSDKRKEVSIFSIVDDSLKAFTYDYERTGTGTDHKLAALFDDNTKRIKLGTGDSFVWQNELDNQLVYFAIKQQLLAGKSQFTIPALNYRGELNDFNFMVEKTESLSLPFGDVEAIKVKRVREGSSRETYAWFAPSMDYLMVRLRQLKDGDEQGDIKLHRYNQITAEPSP
ncbi:DUF3108 domain-containing protein [Alteromonadaceae bacterium BrNp21-10]|nr:DUF3108 domain-containing protein [Alteromonadaceae bacterium BrNp21-10]